MDTATAFRAAPADPAGGTGFPGPAVSAQRRAVDGPPAGDSPFTNEAPARAHLEADAPLVGAEATVSASAPATLSAPDGPEAGPAVASPAVAGPGGLPLATPPVVTAQRTADPDAGVAEGPAGLRAAQRTADPDVGVAEGLAGLRAQGAGLPTLSTTNPLVGARPPLSAQRRIADVTTVSTGAPTSAPGRSDGARGAILGTATPSAPATAGTAVVQRSTAASLGDVQVHGGPLFETGSIGVLALARPGDAPAPDTTGPLDWAGGSDLPGQPDGQAGDQPQFTNGLAPASAPPATVPGSIARSVQRRAATMPLATPASRTPAGGDGGSLDQGGAVGAANQSAILAAVQRAAAPLLERGNARIADDGSIEITSFESAPAATPPPPVPPPATTTASAASVQRLDDSGSAGQKEATTDPHELDQLAMRLYERIRRLLRSDLRVERERAGSMTDNPL
jgi:hypothetical protein